jgi:hypothetical protein
MDVKKGKNDREKKLMWKKFSLISREKEFDVKKIGAKQKCHVNYWDNYWANYWVYAYYYKVIMMSWTLIIIQTIMSNH